VAICLEQGVNDLHMAQLMTLPPHHLLLHENPDWFNLLLYNLFMLSGKEAVKRVSVIFNKKASIR